MEVTIILVAFKYNSEHSIHYAKVHSIEALKDAITTAFIKDADVISIRRVHECQFQTSNLTL